MNDLDDVLSKKEIELEKKFKQNYLISYSYLIASNIDAIHEIFGNGGTEYTYDMIKKISMDTFPFSKSDMNFINKQVEKYLMENYHLKFIQRDELMLKKFFDNK